MYTGPEVAGRWGLMGAAHVGRTPLKAEVRLGVCSISHGGWGWAGPILSSLPRLCLQRQAV